MPLLCIEKGKGNRLSAAFALNVEFADEDDKIFYEVAAHVEGHLVTGNTKHFPKEPIAMTAAEFLYMMDNQG